MGESVFSGGRERGGRERKEQDVCPDLPWRSLIALMIALTIRAMRRALGAITFSSTNRA